MKFLGYVMMAIPLIFVWFILFAFLPVPTVIITALLIWFAVAGLAIK